MGKKLYSSLLLIVLKSYASVAETGEDYGRIDGGGERSFLGFGLEGGQIPVERQGNLYIHTSVHPSVCLSPSGPRPCKGWFRPPRGYLRASRF